MEIKIITTLSEIIRINLFFLFLQINKLTINDHEEASFSFMSENQIRRIYIATLSIWVPPESTQTTGHRHWKPYKERGHYYHVSIKLSGAKRWLVLNITFILSIKYLSIFLTSVIITKQFLSTLVTLMRMWFMSISTRAVLTLVMENGWTVLQSFSTRVTFILHFSVLRSKSYYRWDVEKVERNILITGGENYAKTFPLKPMEALFDTFCTPKNKYAWIGLD